jgi:hypothetical protein
MASRKEVHTVQTDKGWANRAANHRRISNHRTKALAEKAGRNVAVARHALHIVHKSDGSIASTRSY